MAADEHSTTAVVAAFAANLGIAIMKFVGFAFTGSGAMLAEAVHSVADTGNEGLLLLGGHTSKRDADIEHPFGYGRERYFWAFVVSVLLFSVGGLFSIFDGIEKLINPHELESAGWAIGILLGAMVLELLSFRTAVRSTRPVKRSVGWWRFIRTAKTPELPIVLLEDSAALIGLCIALVSIAVAEITGDSRVRRDRQPRHRCVARRRRVRARGRDAQPAHRRGRVTRGRNGASSTRWRTPPTCAASSTSAPNTSGRRSCSSPRSSSSASDLSIRELADVVNEVEAAVRGAVPEARVIYLEPDVVRPELAQ